MITALVVAILGYVVLVGAGVPSDWAIGIAALLFFCTWPFAAVINAFGRAEDRRDREVDAIEHVAYDRHIRRSKRGGEATLPTAQPKVVFRDDRVVINDNRQVNIYNGDTPKEK